MSSILFFIIAELASLIIQKKKKHTHFLRTPENMQLKIGLKKLTVFRKPKKITCLSFGNSFRIGCAQYKDDSEQ